MPSRPCTRGTLSWCACIRRVGTTRRPPTFTDAAYGPLRTARTATRHCLPICAAFGHLRHRHGARPRPQIGPTPTRKTVSCAASSSPGLSTESDA